MGTRALATIRTSPFGALVAVSGLAIAALVLYPIGSMAISLLFPDGHLSLDAFATTLSEPELPTMLVNTVAYVGASAILALLIGATLAWLSERTDASLGWASRLIPLVPLLLPSLAGTIGWVLLLAPRAGLINVALRGLGLATGLTGPFDVFTLPGMIGVTAIFLAPYAYLTVSAALRNLDASMEEASRMSGAGVLATLRRVSLPIVTPALLSASVLILMSGLTLFSVPAVLGATANVDVLATLMYRSVEVDFPPRVSQVVVLSFGLLLVFQAVLALQWRLGAQQYVTVGAHGLRRDRIRLGRWRLVAQGAIVGYLVIAAVLPLVGLFVVSLESFWTPNIVPAILSLANYANIGADPSFAAALRNSVALAVMASLITMAVATLFSYYLANHRNALARLVDLVSTIPASIPHIVLGIAFLLAFNRPPLILYGSTTLLLLAYIVAFIPQALQSAKASFGQISTDLAEASRVFGASEARTFVRIQLPLLLPSILAGALIVAVLTINETNASIMISTVGTQVVGPTLYSLWSDGTVPPVAAFAIIVCGLNALVAAVATLAGNAFTIREAD